MGRPTPNQTDGKFAGARESAITPAEVLVRNVGIGIAPGVFRERTLREQRVHDSDLVMAEKLMASGIKALSGRGMTWVGDVTGAAVPLSPLRDINLFESVMQRHRAYYYKALQHFGAQCHGRKYFRYAVISSPGRIAAGDDMKGLKERMTKRISAWQRIIARKYQMEVLLNAIEYTFDEDSRTFYLHFNILYWPHVVLKSSRWLEFLKFTYEYLGVHWKDCGKVQDFSELLKYVLKSVDRDCLKTNEISWLYESLFRQRFIIVYNSLRQHIAELRQSRMKLVYLAQPGRSEKILNLVKLPEIEPRPPDDDDDDDDKKIKETENLIRGRTGAMVRATPWAEPGTLIENYTPHPKTGGGTRRLAEALERAAASVELWRNNGAPDPATALQVANQWLQAADSQAAAKIVAMPWSKPAPPQSTPAAAQSTAAAAAPLRPGKQEICEEFTNHHDNVVNFCKTYDDLSDDQPAGGETYIVHTTDLTLNHGPSDMWILERPPDRTRSLRREKAPETGKQPHAGLNFLANFVDEASGRVIGREYFDGETGEVYEIWLDRTKLM